MSSKNKRLLMTHSLLNSWDYMFKAHEEYQESAYNGFMRSLNRIRSEPTAAMKKGLEFEQLVTDLIQTPDKFTEDFEHAYLPGALKIAEYLSIPYSVTQMKISRRIEINGIAYLLYGVPDWIGGGVIYDIKFKENLSNYDIGSYLDNTQHRMYFELVPEAEIFKYLISNGHKIYCEEYRREDCRPIQETIIEFEGWLKMYNLWEVYEQKWAAR